LNIRLDKIKDSKKLFLVSDAVQKEMRKMEFLVINDKASKLNFEGRGA